MRGVTHAIKSMENDFLGRKVEYMLKKLHSFSMDRSVDVRTDLGHR